MSFFEPPPPPDLPEEARLQPEWAGPPRHVLGAAVPLRLVLARTDSVVVAVTDATAYPTGFEFTLVLRTRRASAEELDEPFEFGRRLGRAGEAVGELPPELFRFGIAFADGSKATTLGDHPGGGEPGEPRSGPVLLGRSGSGGPGDWEQKYWVWPLPPEGRFAFVCEWPARGIELTRTEIDAELLRSAAGQAETLWPAEDDPEAWGSWTSYGPPVS